MRMRQNAARREAPTIKAKPLIINSLMSLFKILLEVQQQLSAEELFELASNKIAFIAKKQTEALVKALKGDRSAKAIAILKNEEHAKDKSTADLRYAEDVVTELAKASEKHLQWIVNKYIQLSSEGRPPFMLEDVTDRVQDTIEQFEEERKKLKKKDLMQYKTWAELEDTLANEDYDDEPEGSEHVITPVEQSFIDKKEVEVVHRGNGVRVYVPKNYEAAKYFGRGTKWCTASKKSSTYFEQYSKADPLYIVYTKGKKYQLHFKSGQFMDARDRPADVAELFSSNPILYKLFEKQAADSGRLSMMSDSADEETLNKAINAIHKKNQASAFSTLMKELSSIKMKRLKASIVQWVKGEHAELQKKALRPVARSFAKDGAARDVMEFFGFRQTTDSKAWQEKFCKAFTPAEVYDMVGGHLFRNKPASMIVFVSDDILKHIVSDSSTGKELQKALYDDFPKEHDLDISTLVKLYKLGYGIPKEKEEVVIFHYLQSYDAEKQIKQLVDEMHLKIDEPLQLKMVEKKPSIINSFVNPSNKVKERARMFAKRDSERSWRG